MHRLMYITQGSTAQEHLLHLEDALLAGVKLVQLRIKNSSPEEYLAAARTAKGMCIGYGAKLIINDLPEIAKAAGADGVHVGLQDSSITEARLKLPDSIIGGTANTFEDIEQRVLEKADYIGLGPFRYTSTKEKLSPILGLEGYSLLLQRMREKGWNTPVYAIGGITLADVAPLLNTGVYGIALSGALTMASNKREMIQEIQNIATHA